MSRPLVAAIVSSAAIVATHFFLRNQEEKKLEAPSSVVVAKGSLASKSDEQEAKKKADVPASVRGTVISAEEKKQEAPLSVVGLASKSDEVKKIDAEVGAAAAAVACATSDDKLSKLRDIIVDESKPIELRTRSVFLLRQMGTNDAIDALCLGLESPSVLLSHEIAFVLGQMGNVHALPKLTAVLLDEKYDPIVRHEAGEALGAIGDPSSVSVLEKMSKDKCIEVAHTCEIALARIKYVSTNKQWKKSCNALYDTVDPAPAHEENDIAKLQALLTDASLSLFERYRAMFKLRNLGNTNEAAIKALEAGFADASPVLRHEIAYVMGQIQNPASIPALKRVLAQSQEHSMVRHEAAEALGSIGDYEGVLNGYKEDADVIVRESCAVATDIYEYNTSDEFLSVENGSSS